MGTSLLGSMVLIDVLLVAQVDGMDCMAVKQAVKFAKDYALKKGPFVSSRPIRLSNSIENHTGDFGLHGCIKMSPKLWALMVPYN